MDLSILNFIQDNLTAPALDALMPFITFLGDKGFIWIVIGVLMLFFPSYRRYGVVVLAALAIGMLICNITLKPLVERARPFIEHPGVQLLIEQPNGFSFPSGHATSSFAAATALWYCDKRIGIAALVLAALIAFSRLYLYVHYPSDVLCGVLIGIGSALLAIWLGNKTGLIHGRRQPLKRAA